MTNDKIKKIQIINRLLSDLDKSLDKDVDHAEEKIIYSVSGILRELEQHWQGGYFAVDYVTEKCNLIRLDSMEVKAK